MPSTASPLDHETACPTAPSVDLFFDRVVRSVRRKEARVRREDRLTGVPHRFSYCLRGTSRLTGLPVPMLRKGWHGKAGKNRSACRPP